MDILCHLYLHTFENDVKFLIETCHLSYVNTLLLMFIPPKFCVWSKNFRLCNVHLSHAMLGEIKTQMQTTFLGEDAKPMRTHLHRENPPPPFETEQQATTTKTDVNRTTATTTTVPAKNQTKQTTAKQPIVDENATSRKGSVFFIVIWSCLMKKKGLKPTREMKG